MSPATPPAARQPSASFRQRLFARLMAGADAVSADLYGERKARLFSTLRGTVVEIGPGTGVNLDFLPADAVWLGLEPNPAMHGRLRARAAALGREPRIVAARLEDAGLAPASADAVISTLVLCSVRDLAATLATIRQVLRPGGRFVFLEHVADRPGSLRRLVQRLAPYTPWSLCGDGCDPGREIDTAIENAGFARIEMECFMQAGLGLVGLVNRPHIAGTAVR